MIENIKVVEMEEETSTVPADDLTVDLQDVTPRETPDYSLTFPETAELLEEPKHFGRLAMWRKLRQLSGTLINALERLENWTEYLFGVNGKISSPNVATKIINIDVAKEYLTQGKHVLIINSAKPFIIMLSIYLNTSSYLNIPENVSIDYFEVLNASKTSYSVLLYINNKNDIPSAYTLSFTLSGIN